MKFLDVNGLNVHFLEASARENLVSGEEIKVSFSKLQKIIDELDLVNVSTVDVDAHNADTNAHPSLRADLSEIEDRVIAMEVANGVDVTANPFAVTFGSLDGINVNGVWDQQNARIEF